jgi:hypothetical protein
MILLSLCDAELHVAESVVNFLNEVRETVFWNAFILSVCIIADVTVRL